MTAVSSLTGTTVYGYGANGSLTSETAGGVSKVYTYDARNDLRSLSVGGVVQAEYGYSSGNNRVRVTSSGTTTTFLNDGQNMTGYTLPLETRASSTGMPTPTSAPAETRVFGDRLLAEVAGSGRGGGTVFLSTDGHGSTRHATTSAGAVSESYVYDAFGTAVGFAASAATTTYLFGCDTTLDAPSGWYLHGNGVRYRAGAVFTQRDTYAGQTSDPLSLHKYQYVHADPANGHDPSGYSLVGLAVDAVTRGELVAATNIGIAIGHAALGQALAVATGLTMLSMAHGALMDAIDHPRDPFLEFVGDLSLVFLTAGLELYSSRIPDSRNVGRLSRGIPQGAKDALRSGSEAARNALTAE